MKRSTCYRVMLLTAGVIFLEVMCWNGAIDKFTMQPPHRMLVDLFTLLASGTFNDAMIKTFSNAGIAFFLALSAGIATAVVLYRYRLVRDVLDPLFATYYAIPIFAFYPLLIIVLGLGDLPQIMVGFMSGVVVVIVNTLNGLDRVPRVFLKTARINHMGMVQTALHVMLPSAAPYILTGVKLALAYSLIGVIATEFIMSRGGMGYEISFAYMNFDNAIMYPLIILVLFVSISLNALLSRWERWLMLRRGLR